MRSNFTDLINTGVYWFEPIDNQKILLSTYTNLSILTRHTDATYSSTLLSREILLEIFIFHKNHIVGYNPQNKLLIVEIDTNEFTINNTKTLESLDNYPINSSLYFIETEDDLYAIMNDQTFLFHS